MRMLKWILWPFSMIYGSIVALRRSLFDWGLFKRKKSAIPSVVVGNLTVGGTGKTPFVIWLAGMLAEKQPAVLSRGYGRKTSGFLEVLPNSNTETCGDEPVELRMALSATCRNFVGEDRWAAIQKIHNLDPNVGLVLLDDGFQHLSLKASAYVLLCDYQRPFYKDWPLPSGLLREFRGAARHADVIVVSKCPANLSMGDAMAMYNALSDYGKPVYFSCVQQDMPINSLGETLKLGSKVVSVSALGNNKNFADQVAQKYTITTQFSYLDHHVFSGSNYNEWQAAFEKTGATAILTTRKDGVKMGEFLNNPNIFTTQIRTEMLFNAEDDLIELLLKKID